MTFTNEQLIKARSAKSADELLEMAKASGIAMSAEEAAKYFAALHGEGELSDSELASVAGGSKGEEEPPTYNGHPLRNSDWLPCDFLPKTITCRQCQYFVYLPDGMIIENCDGYCNKP